MRLSLRYDMRAPSIGAPAAELYEAAIDQCEWADKLGFETVFLAEHHGADDGYCASPMIQGAAIAARTKRMNIHFSALVAVLHNPLRLAEDLATLDIISGGRIEMTMGIGYRDSEYAMFEIPRAKRVKILEETIGILEKAWTGEPFEYRGQTVKIRPTPVRKPRPPIYIGGSAPASAVRAARIGDNYLPAGDKDGLHAIYVEERTKLGLPIPPRPPNPGPLFLYVSDDPERDWVRLAPHLLYTTNSNAQWAKERGVGSTTYPFIESVDELKQQPHFEVVTPEQCVELCNARGIDSELMFQPLMGGLPPEMSWPSLELFAAKVLPHLVELGFRETQDNS